MNNQKLKTIALVLILILFTGFVSSFTAYHVDEEGKVTKEDDFGNKEENYDYQSSLSSTVAGKDKIKLLEHIKSVYKEGTLFDNGGKLSIITTDISTFKTQVIDIPENAQIRTETEEGKTTLVLDVKTSPLNPISNSYINYQSCISAKTQTCQTIDWKKKAGQFEYGVGNGQVKYSVSGTGEETLELVGEGTIIIGDREFKNIKDAKFKVDKDGKILYAKLTATVAYYGGSGNYFQQRIPFKDTEVIFRPNKNGLIEVDSENGIIRAENVNDLQWDNPDDGSDYRFWMGDDPQEFNDAGLEARGKVEVKYDDEGKLKRIDFKDGILATSDDGHFTSSKGETTVVFDKNDYEVLEKEAKNLVLIEDDKLTVKGAVDARDLGVWTLNYHGRENSLMEYNRETKKISLLAGDALIEDLNYEIEVRDGQTYFKKKSDSGAYSAFSFEHLKEDGVLEEVKFVDDEMVVTISKEGRVIYSDVVDEKIRGQAQTLEEIIFSRVQNDLLTAKQAGYLKKLSELPTDSKEWYDTNLERLKNDMQIGLSDGKKVAATLYTDIEKTIADFENKYGKNPSDPEMKKVLATYYDYAAQLMRQKLGENSFRYAVSEKDEKGVQKITMTRNGEFYASGYRTPPAYYNDYDNQDASFYGMGDVQEKTERYRSLIEDQEKAISLFERARDLGLYSENEFKLHKIDVMISAGEYSIASSQAKDMIRELNPTGGGSNEKFSQASQAYTKLGTALFLEGGDMVAADRAIKDAIQWDSNNEQAMSLRNTFDHAQTSTVAQVAKGEARSSFQDLSMLTGDLGAQNKWQTLADIGAIIGSPWTTSYKLANFGGYLDAVGANIDRASQIGLAAEQMTKLIENGVSLQSYGHELDFSEKFLAVYSANGLDDIIPAQELEEVFSSETYKRASGTQKLEVMLSMLEEKGYSRYSPDLQRRFEDTMKNMAIMEYAVNGDSSRGYKPDPTLKALMLGGEFVEVGDRLGDGIKLSTAEYSALFAADIVLNPLNLIGAGFAARGASASTAGLKLGLGMGLKSGTSNALKAWGGITTKQLMRAYLTEVMVDGAVTLSLTGLAEVNPDVAKNLGLGLGILMGGAFAGGGLMKLAGKADGLSTKVFSDLADGNSFYVKSADDLASLGKELDGFSKASDGSLVGKFSPDGPEIKISVKDGDGLYEVTSLANLKREADAVLGKQTQETLQELAESRGQGKDNVGGCFLAGTKILMADGSYKNIEDILLGDKVVAYDLVNEVPVESEVSTTFKRLETKYYIIEYEVI